MVRDPCFTLTYAMGHSQLENLKLEKLSSRHKTGIGHVLFGKSDFPADDLLVNLVAVAVILFPLFDL